MDSLRNGGDDRRETEQASVEEASAPAPEPALSAPDPDDVEAQLNAELAELKKNDASKFGTRSKDKKDATVPAFRLFETNTECRESIKSKAHHE